MKIEKEGKRGVWKKSIKSTKPDRRGQKILPTNISPVGQLAKSIQALCEIKYLSHA